MRDVTYNQNTTWVQLTGKTIEQLWVDYARNPDIIANIPFITESTTTVEMTTDTLEIDNVTDTELKVEEKMNINCTTACV